jgi:phage shock protein A
MKAMASELNMYQAQVNEYKYEIERITRELQEMKRKYYEQKRRDQAVRQNRDQAKMLSPMHRQPAQGNQRFTGGGYNLAI